MTKKFLRTKWRAFSKLGRGRKKKQKWRKPKGRHNKIREGKAGHIKKVKIGMKKSEKPHIPLIRNIKELEKTAGNEIIIAKVGNKKKKQLAEKAKELGIKILNLSIKTEEKTEENKAKRK
jgi:large subunit ribosomal protein L32e